MGSAATRVRIAPAARRDLIAIYKWSFVQFGEAAVGRYRRLLTQAIKDIGADPQRIGSRELPELTIANVRLYHISLSRDRVRAPAVGTPRHFILYRVANDSVVEIGRVLHDSRDLKRHLPPGYGRAADTF